MFDMYVHTFVFIRLYKRIYILYISMYICIPRTDKLLICLYNDTRMYVNNFLYDESLLKTKKKKNKFQSVKWYFVLSRVKDV